MKTSYYITLLITIIMLITSMITPLKKSCDHVYVEMMMQCSKYTCTHGYQIGGIIQYDNGDNYIRPEIKECICILCHTKTTCHEKG